jgi:hypothetical protein
MDVLKEFKIYKKIFGITTDNCTTQMKLGDKFLEKNNFFHLGCSAHIINLILQNSLLDHITIIKKIKKVVKKVRKSPKLRNLLEVEAKNSNVSFSMFKLNVKTRWCSILHMCKSVLSNKSLLLITETELKGLKEDDFKKIEELVEFLNPFEKYIDLLSSSEFPTIGILFNVIYALQKHFKYIDDNQPKFKSAVKEMKKVFFKYYENLNNFIIIGSLFNPNVKDLLLKKMSTQEGNSEYYETCMNKFKNFFKLYYNDFHNKKNNNQNRKLLNDNVINFLNISDEENDDNEIDFDENTIYTEINVYLLEKRE